MKATIKNSFFAGILSILLLMGIAVLEYQKVRHPVNMYIYYSVYAISIIANIIFIYGFKVISEKINNKSLKIVAYMFIVYSALIQLIFLFLPLVSKYVSMLFIGLVFVLASAAVYLLSGIFMTRLKTEIGNIVRVAGNFQIICGICFLTIILSVIGFLMIIVNHVFLTIILYKSYKHFEENKAK